MSDPQAAPHSGARLVHSYLVGAAERRAIRALCDAAFDGDFDEHDLITVSAVCMHCAGLRMHPNIPGYWAMRR